VLHEIQYSVIKQKQQKSHRIRPSN